MHPTEEKKECVANSNMAKNANFRKTLRAGEQSFFQVFDNFLRRCRLKEREYMVLLEKNNSGFSPSNYHQGLTIKLTMKLYWITWQKLVFPLL